MKTEWNLGLLYKNHNDPKIESDIKDAEKAFTAFAKKYKGKTDYLKNETKLLKSIQAYEALFDKRSFSKPLHYFHLVLSINSNDSVARAKSVQITEKLTKIEQIVSFFDLTIGKIPAQLQKKFIASKRLSKYQYFLKVVFNNAKHTLSEAEEKIMGLKAIPSYQQWVDGTEKLLNKQTVMFKGKALPLPEATNKIGELPLAERRELHESTMKVLESLSDVAESEMNAVVTNKKINDELRGYKEPYDATIMGYQNEPKTVLTLVDVVTKNFPISHRFYALKAKLLKLPNLEYSDRNVGLEHEAKKIPLTEQLEILRKIFKDADPRFESILNDFLKNGQIDVYPKVGKSGGAFCWGDTNRPTFVLLNNTETMDALSTFAHEMGHAFHTQFSKIQPVLVRGYSTATAEVASTFFEAVLFDAVFETLSDAEKISALHNKINDDIQIIFRQIACFNFEKELHQTVRTKGGVSKEEIRAMMNKHMSAYLGPIFKMKEIDGNFFVSWGHIRSFFYVYSYAFGQLVSKALYANYKKDKKFMDKVIKFLSAGGSDSPENIFKSAGIDVTRADFWKTGLKAIEKDIDMLEELTKSK